MDWPAAVLTSDRQRVSLENALDDASDGLDAREEVGYLGWCEVGYSGDGSRWDDEDVARDYGFEIDDCVRECISIECLSGYFYRREQQA